MTATWPGTELQRAAAAPGPGGAGPFRRRTGGRRAVPPLGQFLRQPQPNYVRAFDDVSPLLDALDAAGIPYGAVSNNVHDYQRVKLDTAGLSGSASVGTTRWACPSRIQRFTSRRPPLGRRRADAVGRRQPAPRREGSTAAGLLGVWLNRAGRPPRAFSGREIGTLAGAAGVAFLRQSLAPVFGAPCGRAVPLSPFPQRR